MHDNNQWGLAWKLAQRELRAGLGGFRIFLGCLGIGVAAIAGVGTISSSITAGLNIQAKSLLGGDVDLRSQNRPNTTEQDQYLIENSFAMSKIIVHIHLLDNHHRQTPQHHLQYSLLSICL